MPRHKCKSRACPLANAKHRHAVASAVKPGTARKKQASADGARCVCVLFLLIPLAGCTIHIRTPEHLGNPTTVYLVDYQHHSSLMLPNEEDGFSEFAYGEWNWFAENREGVLDALRIAFLPSKGTLGRRPWCAIGDANSLEIGMGVEAVYPIHVEQLRAEALSRRLNDDFARDPSREIHNAQESMAFVPHTDTYWLGWNCNTAVAAWLEFLGCQVTGSRHFADFRIEPKP